MSYVKRTTIIKDLKLPATYQIMVSVSGHIGKTHYAVVKMGSSTPGHMKVYAISVSFAKWYEIQLEEFKGIAQQIIWQN